MHPFSDIIEFVSEQVIPSTGLYCSSSEIIFDLYVFYLPYAVLFVHWDKSQLLHIWSNVTIYCYFFQMIHFKLLTEHLVPQSNNQTGVRKCIK